MSDWTYVAGEGGYDQDFRIIDQETGDLVDVSGANPLKMFIVTTDRNSTGPDTTDPTKNFPVGGVDMIPATNNDGESVARLVVQANVMPQEADVYLAQIQITQISTFRTFIFNLRVIRNIGST